MQMTLCDRPLRLAWVAMVTAGTWIAQPVDALPKEPADPHAPPAAKVTTFEQAMDVLYAWLGAWTAVETHYDASGHAIAEVKGTEESRWILNQHAIRRVYRNSGSGNPFEAQGTFTWSNASKTFRGFWIDNRSVNGPSTSRGTWLPDTRTMVYELEHQLLDGVQRFKVVEHFVDDDHRVATTYRIQGKEFVKILKVYYTRSAPCPEQRSSVRILMDGME